MLKSRELTISSDPQIQPIWDKCLKNEYLGSTCGLRSLYSAQAQA